MMLLLTKASLSLPLLLLLASCNLLGSSSDFPDKTPQLWSIYVSGFSTPELINEWLVGLGEETTTQEQLIAINLDKQEAIWRSSDLGPQLNKRQLASDGVYLYAPLSQTDGFSIYELATGKLIKAEVFPDPYESSPVSMHPILHDTRLYISHGRYLYAYDVTDPVNPLLAWSLSYEHRLKTLSVDEMGNLFISVASRRNIDTALQRLNPADGSLMWQASTYTEKVSEQGTADALKVDGDKLIAYAFGTIQAFDKITGERLWVSDVLLCSSDGVQIGYAMEFAEGNAYISPAGGSCVFAVDLTDGSILWMHNAKVASGAWFTYGGKPKYYNGVIYATNSYLWALDAQTGEVLSLSNIQDRLAQFTYIEEYNGEILVWGERLRAYKPVR